MGIITVAYIPALHEGYVSFLRNYNHPLYLVSDEILKELEQEKPYYGRDIRALDAETIKKTLDALNVVPSVALLNPGSIKRISDDAIEIVMPDEDISHDVSRKYFKESIVTYVNTFLRWDRKISDEEFIVPEGRTLSRDPHDQEMIRRLKALADRSSDWWRQIAAAAVKDGVVLAEAYNRHLPHDQNPNILGDPRSNYDYREKPAGYTSMHAEADIVAQMARKSESLEGASLYVTTFPCDACARLLVRSGVKKVYYKEGFSRLDSEEILQGAGIEIVLVETEEENIT
ncbi:MAG: deaminase [Candidatus Paceibacterota bacterium]